MVVFPLAVIILPGMDVIISRQAADLAIQLCLRRLRDLRLRLAMELKSKSAVSRLPADFQNRFAKVRQDHPAYGC
jgi:hypothetical protein